MQPVLKQMAFVGLCIYVGLTFAVITHANVVDSVATGLGDQCHL